MNIKQIIACILFYSSVSLAIPNKAQATEYRDFCAASISDAKQIAYNETGQSWTYYGWGNICGYRGNTTLYIYTMYR